MMEDFKQLAEQTLEALLAAHNLRILHRDIKPENIKVNACPEVACKPRSSTSASRAPALPRASRRKIRKAA